MKFFLLGLITIVLFSCSTPTPQQKPETPIAKKPNILFLLTDDQRFDAIHALGNKELETPNMDLLVNEGTAFTQAHIMGALGGAICMPSRAMIMTSKNVFHVHRDGAYVPEEDTLLPELLRANGYQTFGTGKWHNGKAAYHRSFTNGDNIFFGGMHFNEEGHFNPRVHHYDSTGAYETPFELQKFSSVGFADAAINFFEVHDKEKPFFAFVSFTSPHDPRTPPKEYGKNYDSTMVSLPENFMPEHPFDNGELKIRDEVLLPHPRTKEAVKGEIATYYGMVSEVDHQIGRIINKLKESGEYDNTIIVFAGDNGLAVGQHGLLGKQNLYDHSVRVPMIFAGPGINKGAKSKALVYLNDIFPTICKLVDVKVPLSVEGKPVSNGLSGNEFKGRDHLFFTYQNQQRGIRKGNYKYIKYNVNGVHKAQLFDLEKDPKELNNLAENSEFDQKVKELDQLLIEESKRQDDFCDLTQEGWGRPEKMTWNECLGVNP